MPVFIAPVLVIPIYPITTVDQIEELLGRYPSAKHLGQHIFLYDIRWCSHWGFIR